MQANPMVVQLNKRNTLPDALALLGFFLEFLFSGTTMGQVGFLMVLAAGMICILQYRPMTIRISSFCVFYLLLTLYFQLQIWLGNSIIPSVSSAYVSTMLKCLVYMVFAYQYLIRRSYREMIIFFVVFTVMLVGYLVLSGAIFAGGRLQIGRTNANSIGMICAVTVALMGHRLIAKDCYYPMVYYAVAALLIIVILMTGSRKSLLICIVPLFLYYIFQRKRQMFLRTVIIVLLIFLAYLLLMNVPALYNSVGYRIEGLLSWVFTGEATEASIESRTSYIQIGMAAFLTKPWTGLGLAAFSTLEGAYGTYSHNNFIEMLVSGGIPALVLFYFPFLLLAIRLFKQRKDSDICNFLLMLLICQVVIHSGLIVYFSREDLFVYLFIFAVAAQTQMGEREEIRQHVERYH